MLLVKRALLRMLRKSLGTLALWLLIVVIGTLLTSTFSLMYANQRNELNMLQNTPRVATITTDWGTMDTTWLTSETVREIGELPYVEKFDYFSRHFVYSKTLERYTYIPPEEWHLHESEKDDPESLRPNMWRDGIPHGLEVMTLRGGHNPEVFDIQAGFLNLESGRTFTEVEVLNGGQVALISKAFATINNLVIGDTFQLEVIFFDTDRGSFDSADLNLLNPAIPTANELLEAAHAMQTFEMEVIGIFDLNAEITSPNDWQNFQYTQDTLNSIYVPNQVIQNMGQAFWNMWLDVLGPDFSWDPDDLIYDNLVENRFIPFINTIFMLYDPRDLQDFSQAANDILPPGLMIADLSDSTEGALHAIVNVGNIVSQFLWGVIGASILIFSLMVLLFLRDRQKEIGIYLALGEKRWKIIFQYFIEIKIIFMLSMIPAIFLGNIFSGELSSRMLRQELARPIPELPWSGDFMDPELTFYNPSIDELIQMFDVSLDAMEIFVVYISLFAVLLISTMIFALYVSRLNTKDILQKGSIG